MSRDCGGDRKTWIPTPAGMRRNDVSGLLPNESRLVFLSWEALMLDDQCPITSDVRLAAVSAEDAFENPSCDGQGFIGNGEAEVLVASRINVPDLEAF